jgi:Eukaryotic protein of unknown function (DUF1764)
VYTAQFLMGQPNELKIGRKTEEGFSIYKEDELGINKDGGGKEPGIAYSVESSVPDFRHTIMSVRLPMLYVWSSSFLCCLMLMLEVQVFRRGSWLVFILAKQDISFHHISMSCGLPLLLALSKPLRPLPGNGPQRSMCSQNRIVLCLSPPESSVLLGL